MSELKTMFEEIKACAEFLKSQTTIEPEYGIILGTGLGGLAEEIEVETKISYESIPGFPTSTVTGHAGQLLFGHLGGKKVVVMQGRFHYYEGYTMAKVVYPVRVMKMLGIKGLFISNASGGVNPDYTIGDLMILKDHINLFPDNPLIGPNIDELGPRFPDMSVPYNKDWIEQAVTIAENAEISVQVGVYAGLTGPTLETPHEYYYIRTIGADAVGMSTIPEVIAARHMDIPCFAMSIITDLGVKGKIKKVTHEDVQQVAEVAEPKMTSIFKMLIENLD